MNNKETTIQISRSRYVEKDRSIAVLRLDQHFFDIGEPVMVRYYLDPDKQTKTDTLLAIGVREGYGKDCYKILSLGGLELVRDVVSELPDVSELVHGELYLYQDPETFKWYYVYEVGGVRQVEEITSGPTTFVNITDRYRWFWKDGVLKREDDFYTSDKMDQIIDELLNLVSPPEIVADCLEGYLFESGTTQTLTLQIRVKDKTGKDITEDCVLTIDGSPIVLDSSNCWVSRNVTISHDYKIVATFSANGKEYSVEKVVQVRFGYYIYYGKVAIEWEMTETNIKDLEFSFLTPRKNIRWDGIKLNKEKTVFAYPKAYGQLQHIFDDNGLCYIPDYTCTEVNFKSNGVTYYVYEKIEEIQTTDFLQWFIFAAEDTTDDIRFEKYDEVIETWNKQGLPGGMVIVGKDGKIDETLIPSSSFPGTYVGLINFVNQYPQFGINPGDLWYNTKTKKIFVGISEDSGKIEEPKSDKIYINLTDRTLYIWKNNDMENIGGSVMSDKINNLRDIL